MPAGRAGTLTATSSGGFTEKYGITNLYGTNFVISSSQVFKTGTNELLETASGSIYFTAANFGTALQVENMLSGNDTITGNTYNNVLRGYGGNDRIDGGAGTNTAVFSGFASAYQITRSGAAFSINGPDGTDSLLNIQRLQFDNQTISYDINGNAGQVYRMYQAALNRAPDTGGLSSWINQMDHGVTLTQVASGFTGSIEFKGLYGNNSTDAAFVKALYSNVLHRVPDTGGFTYWTNVLGSQLDTRDHVLIGFSESTENQVSLIGAIGNGIVSAPIA